MPFWLAVYIVDLTILVDKIDRWLAEIESKVPKWKNAFKNRIDGS